MKPFAFLLASAPFLMLSANPLSAQPVVEDSTYSFADLADSTLGAPIVARAEIDEAIRLKNERAVGVAPGHVRYYVEANLVSLIRSGNPLPAQIRYLVDMPLDSDGDRPEMEERQVLLMARPVAGRPGEVQLLPGGQIDWTSEREQVIRTLLSDASAPRSPGEITGIANIFSVPGTLPGESETQIFLQTADDRPVSISVLRRPQQQPRWGLSLGDLAADTLPPPQPNTLLWYRLACSLPESVPASAMEAMDPSQIDRARADYELVIRSLGSCERRVQR